MYKAGDKKMVGSFRVRSEQKIFDQIFKSKEDATNFIVEILINEANSQNREIDSTIFDDVDNFEIEQLIYENCECCEGYYWT